MFALLLHTGNGCSWSDEEFLGVFESEELADMAKKDHFNYLYGKGNLDYYEIEEIQINELRK